MGFFSYSQAHPSHDKADEIQLEHLGYAQELRRGMGLIGSIGVTTGIIQPLLSGGQIIFAFVQGGPFTVIWSFVIFFFVSLGLLLSMAEISSKYITAGGPYNWAGRSMAGVLGTIPSYIVAWCIMLSFFGSMASVNSAAAQELYSMNMMRYWGARPSNPHVPYDLDIFDPATGYALSYQGSQNTWKNQFGITVAITASQFLFNLLPLKYMNKVSWISFGVMVIGSACIIIGLPAIAPTHQTAKWVFTQWYPQYNPGDPAAGIPPSGNPIGPLANTGLPTNGWMFCSGMLMAQYLVLCYDVPSHMAEETHNASWTVPRSMIGSFVVAGVINFGFLLSYMFSLQSIPNFGNGVTQGLFFIGSLFWDVFAARFPDTDYASGLVSTSEAHPLAFTSSSDRHCLLKSGASCLNVITGQPNPTVQGRNGAMFFTFLIFCGAYICGLMNCCAGSRFLYSLARDGGMPFSGFFKKVANFNGVPMNTLILFACISIAFLTCNLSARPLTAYNAVSGISANGYLLAYGIPCLLRLTTARNTFEASPDFDLGIMSKPLAALGTAVAFFSVATIALPALLPANKNTLNYAPVALGCAITAALLLWPIATRFWGFTGPSTGVGHDSVHNIKTELVAEMVDEESARAANKL